MKTKTVEKTPIEVYAQTSVLIGAKRGEILERLVILHEQLCELASLERTLEKARSEADRNEVAPEVNEHLRQVVIPTQKVWSHIDEAMKSVAAFNGSGVSPVELPGLYRRSNRIEDFTKGMKA